MVEKRSKVITDWCYYASVFIYLFISLDNDRQTHVLIFYLSILLYNLQIIILVDWTNQRNICHINQQHEKKTKKRNQLTKWYEKYLQEFFFLFLLLIHQSNQSRWIFFLLSLLIMIIVNYILLLMGRKSTAHLFFSSFRYQLAEN